VAQKNFSKDADKAFESNKRSIQLKSELYKKAYTKAKRKEDKALIIFQNSGTVTV